MAKVQQQLIQSQQQVHCLEGELCRCRTSAAAEASKLQISLVGVKNKLAAAQEQLGQAVAEREACLKVRWITRIYCAIF